MTPDDDNSLGFTQDEIEAMDRMVEEEVFGVQKMPSEEGIKAMKQRLKYLKTQLQNANQTLLRGGSVHMLGIISQTKKEIAETELRIKEYKTMKEGKN